MCIVQRISRLAFLTAVFGVLCLSGNRAFALEQGEVGAAGSTQWLSYNNGYRSQRYSPLGEINAQNAAALEELCRLKVAESGPFETGLVMADGTLYLTRSLDTYAVDATNCKVRWK